MCIHRFVYVNTQSYHLSMLQKYYFQWICHDYSKTCRLITYSLLGSSLTVLSPQSFYLKFLGQGILYDHPPHLEFPYHTINMTLRGISVKSKLSPIDWPRSHPSILCLRKYFLPTYRQWERMLSLQLDKDSSRFFNYVHNQGDSGWTRFFKCGSVREATPRNLRAWLNLNNTDQLISCPSSLPFSLDQTDYQGLWVHFYSKEAIIPSQK